ncbi:3'-5' exonuclease [Acinetobacter sp. YH01009]|uniref:3'-5' exonuclease n=1 Tax=Acinetobacter TaxID=469 RepID=UPI0015D341A4|nr:3'-5' exonuclease [Acinetobacter sp. YH01009]
MTVWDNFITVDTETTGIGSDDQIIQLSIVNLNNEILFNEYFKPSVAISQEATNVHGITMEQLLDKPSFSVFSDQILKLLRDKYIIGYSIDFDIRMIKNHLPDVENLGFTGLIDLIKIYAEYHGVLSSRGGYKLQKLSKALNDLSIDGYISSNTKYNFANFHNAVTDVRATNELFFELLKRSPELFNSEILSFLQSNDFTKQISKFRGIQSVLC